MASRHQPADANINSASAGEAVAAMETFFGSDPHEFLAWLQVRLTGRVSPFERLVIASELEILGEFAAGKRASQTGRNQIPLL